MPQLSIDPQFVPWSHVAPNSRSASAVSQLYDALAIYGEGDSLAKLQVTKPNLLLRDLGEFVGRQFIQIEKQEVVFKARAEINQIVATTLLLACH